MATRHSSLAQQTPRHTEAFGLLCLLGSSRGPTVSGTADNSSGIAGIALLAGANHWSPKPSSSAPSQAPFSGLPRRAKGDPRFACNSAAGSCTMWLTS